MKRIIVSVGLAAATIAPTFASEHTFAESVKPSVSLELLANEKRYDRQLNGALTAVAGVGTIYLGHNLKMVDVCGWFEPEEYCAQDDFAREFDAVYTPAMTAVGGLTIASGILQMAIPSKAERAHKAVSMIEQGEQREAVAFAELTTLARTAKYSRYAESAIYGVSSVVLLIGGFSSDEAYPIYLGSGLVMGGMSAAKALIHSPEENALNAIEPDTLQVQPALTLDGGWAVRASYSF